MMDTEVKKSKLKATEVLVIAPNEVKQLPIRAENPVKNKTVARLNENWLIKNSLVCSIKQMGNDFSAELKNIGPTSRAIFEETTVAMVGNDKDTV